MKITEITRFFENKAAEKKENSVIFYSNFMHGICTKRHFFSNKNDHFREKGQKLSLKENED